MKSLKYHLKRVASDIVFAYEKFYTLITEVEAILNSRYLTPISVDPNDPLVLTPGHFLIGDSLTCPPELDFSEIPNNRLSTWQNITKQHFWKHWHQEYLTTRTSRRAASIRSRRELWSSSEKTTFHQCTSRAEESCRSTQDL